MRPTWILGSNNVHKHREIAQILASFRVRLLRPPDLKLALEVDEWASTFAGNAALKAIAFAEAAGMVAMADDSGLEVDGLGGAPGVLSARYAGPDASDEENNALLIENLAGASDDERTARYRCVIAIARRSGSHGRARESQVEEIGPRDAVVIGEWEVRTFAGALEGRIDLEPKGHAGFGYDPYFTVAGGRRVAEMPDAEKHAISHRGAALREMRAFLRSESGRGWLRSD